MWKAKLTAAFLTTMLLCLLTACPGAVGTGPAVDGSPVAGLTLPAGSTVDDVKSSNLNWGVDFHCPAGQDAVLAYIGGQLSAKGYKEDLSYRDTPGDYKVRVYTSGDGHWSAMVNRVGQFSYQLGFADLTK